MWIHTPGTAAGWAQLGDTTLIPVVKLPGILSTLVNRAFLGQITSSGTQDVYGAFTPVSPVYSTSAPANAGMLFLAVDITLNNSGFTSLSINEGNDKFYMNGFTLLSHVNGSTTYAASATNGVPIGSINIYNASTFCGTHTLYLAKNAASNLGYYWHYDGDSCLSQRWSFTAEITLAHLSQR